MEEGAIQRNLAMNEVGGGEMCPQRKELHFSLARARAHALSLKRRRQGTPPRAPAVAEGDEAFIDENTGKIILSARKSLECESTDARAREHTHTHTFEREKECVRERMRE